jgi:hypothetical protein
VLTRRGISVPGDPSCLSVVASGSFKAKEAVMADQHHPPVTAVAFGGLDQRRPIRSLFSPLANRRTGIAFFFAHRYTSAT